MRLTYFRNVVEGQFLYRVVKNRGIYGPSVVFYTVQRVGKNRVTLLEHNATLPDFFETHIATVDIHGNEWVLYNNVKEALEMRDKVEKALQLREESFKLLREAGFWSG